MTSPKGALPTGTSKADPSYHSSRKTVLLAFGTRPEAVKLCPLIAELKKSPVLRVVVCVTAQHRSLLDQVLATFAVEPEFDLDIMLPRQSLASLTSRLLAAFEPVFAEVQPDLVVVQGDTTTTLCGALAAFYAAIPVAHIEAGLRTFDFSSPFPEEMNRVFTTQLAALHFPPTASAAKRLALLDIPPDRIEVTGNTGIDAVLTVRDALEGGKLSGLSLPLDIHKKLVLVTAHRRESFGDGLLQICNAVADVAQRGDVQIVWPLHPNPNIRQAFDSALSRQSNVLAIEPLEYVQFVDLMRRAYLILTDSGGVQEEAPSLGKPVLVLRDKTERPEGVEAGTARLVGSDRKKIVAEANLLLDDPAAYQQMAQIRNPYGDGRASERIAARIRAFLDEGAPRDSSS